jgi:DNA repair protein SbcC/Rad50
MRPVRLQLSGFTCFKDEVVVSFESLDLFVVSGATGSGKSSLLDAMLFALYGRVTRTDLPGIKDLIALGRSRLAVVLDFRVGEQLYRVSRVKHRKAGRAAEAALERWEGDGFHAVTDHVGRVDREIECVLGVGFEAFTQAVVLPQGQFATFLHSKPAQRRAMLNQLMRLEVYEHMRKAAAERAQHHGQQRQSLERRLSEDFQGVTAEAVHALRCRERCRRREAEELHLRLAQLEERRSQLRSDHGKTKELEQKEQQRTALEEKSKECDSRKQQVLDARRAAGILPLLDQADALGEQEDRCEYEMLEARRQEERCEADHAQAKEALDAALVAAQALPALRQRRERLAEVMGKLSLRDELARQCARLQEELEKWREEHAARKKDRDRLAAEVAQLEGDRDAARDEIAHIGYNSEGDRALEAVRSEAALLTSLRQRLVDITREVERALEAAEETKATAAVRAGAKADADRAEQGAQCRLEAAREALALARDAHAASHLRGVLAAGHPCPVCEQEVTSLPAESPMPALEATKTELERAQRAYETACKQNIQSAQEAGATQAAAEHALALARHAEAARDSLQHEVTACAASLQSAVGDRLSDNPGETIEDRILAAAEASATQRERHGQAAPQLQELEQKLALSRQAFGSAKADLSRAAEALAGVVDELPEHEDALRRLQAEIDAVTTAPDPKLERDEVASQIQRLEAEVTDAERAASETALMLAAATARAEELAQTAALAREKAEAAELRAAAALVEAGFSNAVAARAAVRPEEELARIEGELAAYAQAAHTLDARIAELRRELNGRRVSDPELHELEAEHQQCSIEHQKALEEQAALTERAAAMEAKLSLAGRLQSELREHDAQHRVYDHLAGDLRSDHLQAYVLEETLAELVRGASVQLGRLTSDRYELDYVDDEIVVVDRDNAGERRGTDTLSGGETFLTSLALALELSAQVQRAVGAVSLDSLFIDEGFGTLDPETLRVVADAVRSLQVGGRMVGIITHIPELKDEFDQRVLVTREAGVSTVRVEEG